MSDIAVTQLVQAARGGDSTAEAALFSQVYSELYRLASYQMSKENSGHTLQATALVNEAYLRMVDGAVESRDRVHFLALSATTMRRILVDHARSKNRIKRGGDVVQVTLQGCEPDLSSNDEKLVELNDALEKLAEFDHRAAKALELMFFGGLTYEDIAEFLGVGRSTVFEDIKAAKAWLASRLS